MTGAPAAAADPAPAPATHSVDRGTFLALARGRGGASAVGRLRAGQLSKRLLLLTAVSRTAAERGAPADAQARLGAVLDELARIRKRSRVDWESLLLQPYLDLWAAECLRQLYGADGADGTTAGDARTDGLDGLANLLAPFLPTVPDAARPVTMLPVTRPPAVRLDHAGRRLDLWIDDRGPYREVHGEPLAGPLGPAELRVWQEALAHAWELLVQRHPWHAEALAAGLTTLVPLLPRPDGTAVSSAARRAFGAVALSLPATPVLLALTMVHEFLHAQLGALLDLVALHGPDSGARYHAPWRPDARPAGALLQGAYAHLGVADFWRVECAGQPTEQAGREYAHWRTSTLAAAGTLLSSGELTAAGREFVDELTRTMSAW